MIVTSFHRHQICRRPIQDEKVDESANATSRRLQQGVSERVFSKTVEVEEEDFVTSDMFEELRTGAQVKALRHRLSRAEGGVLVFG